MNHVLSSIHRWFLIVLAFVCPYGALRAANTTEASGNGAYAKITITAIEGPLTFGQYRLSYTIEARTGPSAGSNSSSASAAIVTVVGLSTSGFNQNLTTSGTTAPVSPYGTIGGKPYYLLNASAGSSGNNYVNFFVDDPVCSDKTYSWYVKGTNILGTRYQVITVPDQGVGTTLADVTLGFGQVHHFEGTVPQFCGSVKLVRYDAGNENPWTIIDNPQTTPFPSPPLPPGPPAPLPTGPNVPTPPSGGTTPTPPAPPAPPPAGGGGGTEEVIEWTKDNNAVIRHIGTGVGISNEYLKQIRDNTGYASDRLKTLDENTQKIADDVQRKADQEQEIKDKTPDVAAQQAEGAAAGQAVLDAMGTISLGSTDVASIEPSEEWEYHLFGGFEMDLNPFREDRAGPLAAFIKSMIAWFLVWKWYRWAIDKGFSAGTAAFLSPQARGNTVAAGTGGQATSLVAAVLITAIILSMIVVIVAALRDTALGGFSLGAITTINPFSGLSGIAGKIVYVMDKVVPLSTIIAVAWNQIAFHWYIQGVAWVAMTLKRFIVP